MLKDRKEIILQKAFELYVINGYANVSITDLQIALDMGRGTMYYYFKDKDDLLRAVIKRYFITPHQGSMMSLPKDLSVEQMIANRVDIVESLKEPLLSFENKNVNTSDVVSLMQSAYRLFPDLNRKANRLYRLEYELWCKALNNDIHRGIIQYNTPVDLIANMFCNLKYGYDAGNNQTMDFELIRSSFYYLYQLIKAR